MHEIQIRLVLSDYLEMPTTLSLIGYALRYLEVNTDGINGFFSRIKKALYLLREPVLERLIRKGTQESYGYLSVQLKSRLACFVQTTIKVIGIKNICSFSLYFLRGAL